MSGIYDTFCIFIVSFNLHNLKKYLVLHHFVEVDTGKKSVAQNHVTY